MATTSTYEDKEFGAHFLEDIIDYIAGNFEPDDVYTEDTLKGYVSENFDPDDVFSNEKLIMWAENNGFVEEKTDA